jgi:signal peptidase I
MYNPGDTVKLRDGIPGLTVINTAHDTVYVTWDDGNYEGGYLNAESV